MSLRRSHRIAEELRALTDLARHSQRFAWRFTGRMLAFCYTHTPGLVLDRDGISVWPSWSAGVFLGPKYPIQAPEVVLAPAGRKGRPFHPNVLPHPPYRACYGRHLPAVLLDELVRRLEGMIMLRPGSVMTDERDSLDPRACRFVRRLIQEGAAPLRQGRPLPAWCSSTQDVRGES